MKYPSLAALGCEVKALARKHRNSTSNIASTIKPPERACKGHRDGASQGRILVIAVVLYSDATSRLTLCVCVCCFRLLFSLGNCVFCMSFILSLGLRISIFRVKG